MKIFDAHVHVFPDKIAQKATDSTSNYYGIPMYSVGTLDNILKEISEKKIDGCLIHSTATKAEQVVSINNFVAETKKCHPGLVGFGTMHPDFSDIDGEAERIVSLGLLGIKLHSDFQNFAIDDKKAFPIYRAAIKHKLPILFHAGDANSDLSSPVRIRRVHDLFPELIIIAAHLGGYLMWNDAENCLVGKNIYMDISSALVFMEKDHARRMILRHGTDKILYGTDFPMHDPALTTQLVYDLGLTNEENEQIFYKNAEKLLGITV